MVSADTLAGPLGSAFPLHLLPSPIKTKKHERVAETGTAAAVAKPPQLQEEYTVSPSTPLLSTAIEENGWVCGQNDQGQLGAGGCEDVIEPQPLQVVRQWAALSFGESHAAGISGDGMVYTWGHNDRYQLGQNLGRSDAVPQHLTLLRGLDVRAVACGAQHTVAITPGEVISWGCNEEGQCGQGERAEVAWVKPRFIRALSNIMVTQVVCGAYHTLSVTATSQVFAWGLNSCGQLGLGDRESRRSPALVEALWAFPVQQLAAGAAHSAALTSNGFLFTWGGNDKGQLGLGPAVLEPPPDSQTLQRSESEKRRVRRKVNQRHLSGMLDMGINQEHAELALVETGNVGIEVAAEWLFSCPEEVLARHLAGGGGSAPSTPANPDGDGDAAMSLRPKRVVLHAVRWVTAGAYHTVAATDASVTAWGLNASGQLGLGSFQDQCQPAAVAALEGRGIHMVACGAEHTLFLARDGSVYGCGSNEHGQLPIAGQHPRQSRFAAAHEAHPANSETATCSSPSESSSSPHSSPQSVLPETSFTHPGAASEVPVPALLRLKFLGKRAVVGGEAAAAPVVSAVAAGGCGSAFLTRQQHELPETRSQHLWDTLQAAVDAVKADEKDAMRVMCEEGQRHLGSIILAVEMIFGSAAALCAAFGHKDTVGLEVQRLEEAQCAILGLYRAPPPPRDPQHLVPGGERSGAAYERCAAEVRLALAGACERLLDDLIRNVKLLGVPERAQVLLAAAQSPLMGDEALGPAFVPRLCNTLLTAPSSCRQYLVVWWAEYPPAVLEERVVRPLQQYLTAELMATKKLTTSVMNVIKVLALVESANQVCRLLPPEAFYNELISDKLDVEDHYVAWRQTHDSPQASYANNEGPFSFCSYPFLLNPRAKSKLLHTEARVTMTQTVNQARLEHIHTPLRPRRHAEPMAERILPDEKVRLRPAAPPLPRPHPDSHHHQRGSEAERREARQRERNRGIRNMWQNIWRNTDGTASSDYPVDERMMAAREVSGVHASGDSGAGTVSSIWRQGSMNLPPPEESGVPPDHPDMCILRIRRNHLVEDALAEIARQRPRDLFKPLRVHFIGEDGIDAGGVKKEFFQLLVTELLCPDYSMLIYQAESRTYWFNPSTLEAEAEFMLVGLVLGLAIYNAVLLDFPLPLALYKKLLGQPATLRDLQDMEPQLGKSMRALLDFDGEGGVEEVFCQNFTAALPGIGEVLMVPLKPEGEEIMVTEDNRREYVDLYVDFFLTKSIAPQFEAFAKGFLMLCGGPALHLFNATELERLVCGNPILDFAALQANARYDGGYSADHRVVQWLWQIVQELEALEKRRFLKFFSGSDRAPIGGLGNLRCVIQRDGPDSNKLPTSHTCFNTLLLPSYRSREKMAERLRLAIMNAEGFGLE